MNSTSRLAILGLALSLSTLLLFSCEDPQPEVAEMVPVPDNEANCRNLMEWHLKALAEKNLAMLESTLSPDGEMQLILPSDEIAYGTEYFMEMHEQWFSDTTWSYSAEILSVTANDGLGFVTTEALYSEPLRDGVPYFNRLCVTYNLKLLNNTWYVILDHASSIQKSTDIEE